MAPYSLQKNQPHAKKLKTDFLKSWPELSVNQMTKYTTISESKVKGRMHAQRSNIR